MLSLFLILRQEIFIAKTLLLNLEKVLLDKQKPKS